MSRWFRHYAGMMRDEKLVKVAVRAKQPVERVLWVWGAILESAAEINDDGRYDLDAGEAAYFLRCDETDISGIETELEGAGRVSKGVVERWWDRQHSSDSGAERQRRYRERKARNALSEGDDNRNGDGRVTSRDAEVTASRDRDRNISEDANASSSPEPEKSAPVVVRLPVTSGPDFEILETDVSEWSEAFPAVDVRQQLNAMRAWLKANPTRRKTRRGVKRFVVSWLDREQNRGRASQPRQGQPPSTDPFLADLQRRAYGHEPDHPTDRHDDESNGPGGFASAPVVDLVAVSQNRGR